MKENIILLVVFSTLYLIFSVLAEHVGFKIGQEQEMKNIRKELEKNYVKDDEDDEDDFDDWQW